MSIGFSKWGPEPRRLTGLADAIVLCGVSTECCVLATALAAVDEVCSLLKGLVPQLVISSTGAEQGGDRR